MLWGGRFAGGPHPDMFRLTTSIDIDIALLPFDLLGDAGARTCAPRGGRLVEKAVSDDRRRLRRDPGGCTRTDELGPDPHDEDVHSLVERELTERLGDVGARIHAGRSRNDLVAADLRLWTLMNCDELLRSLRAATE